jgi:DNA (cytosine-5)-methyltransferase 1
MIYLNENNPHAAQWLRNLIAKGHLPNGIVDQRSVVAVSPIELSFTQCHFFAGIGGWPLALSLAGWPSEREVWTASLPCQPLSVAGKRKGAADERHLWPTFNALVDERRPATIFGEQVASKAGREWLSAVRSDLEDLGYAVAAACLPACSVGAPHRRYRFFWLAHRDDAGREGRLSGRKAPLAHGVSGRVGRLRAYGNAIVPQVAAAFVSAFLDAEGKSV